MISSKWVTEPLEKEIEKLQKKLELVAKFAENVYLKDVKSTTDFRGGYAACLEDLKQLLENK